MARRIEAKKSRHGSRDAEREEAIAVSVQPIPYSEFTAAGPDNPYTDIVSEDYGIDQFFSCCALPLSNRHASVDDRGAWMSADHMSAVDLFAMAGRAVRQCRVCCWGTKTSAEDVRLSGTTK